MADITVKVGADTSEFQSSIKGLGNLTSSVFKGTLASQAVMKGLSMLKGGFDSAASAGMSFESMMSQVQALSGASAADMQLLADKAKEYGASTAFSATQSAEALKYMALAGWDTQQSIDALGGVLNLAAAGGMDLGRASDMITDYISAFGLEAGNAIDMANKMSYAQANSNTSAEQLGEAYSNCATNLAAAGQTMESTTALLMAMADVGNKGHTAGTGLSAIMAQLTQKMENGKVAINGTNIALADEAGNWRDLIDILADVEQATAGLGEAARSQALGEVFNRKSLSAINNIFASGIDKVQDYRKELDGVSDSYSSEQAETMLDNLSGKVTIMKSAIEGLQITAYESFEGIAKQGVSMATDIVNALNDAGKTGGLEGIFDEVINQFAERVPDMLAKIPDILADGVKMFEKKIPMVMKSFAGASPNILKGLGNLGGSFYQVLYEGIGEGIAQLIYTLPEFVPALGEGLYTMISKATEGIANASYNVLKAGFSYLGLEMPDVPNVNKTFQKWLEGATGGTTENVELGKYDSHVTVNTPTVEFAADFSTIKDTVYQAFTNGIGSDDSEAAAKAEEEVNKAVGEAKEKVDNWLKTSLESLKTEYDNGNITASEYTEQKTILTETANTAKQSLEESGDAMITWIQTYSGQATATVQAGTADLDAAIATIEDIENRLNLIQQRLGESKEEIKKRDQSLVAGGYTKDADTILNAFDANQRDMEAAIAENKQKEALYLEELKSSMSPDEYSVIEGSVKASFEKQREDIVEFYSNENLLMMQGLADAYDVGDDDSVLAAREKYEGIIRDMFKAMDYGNLQGYAEGLGFTEKDWQDFADAIMLDTNGKSPMQAVVDHMLGAYRKGSEEGEIERLGEGINAYLATWPEELRDIIAKGQELGIMGISLDENGLPDFFDFTKKLTGNVDPSELVNDLFPDGKKLEAAMDKQDYVFNPKATVEPEIVEAEPPKEIEMPEMQEDVVKPVLDRLAEQIEDGFSDIDTNGNMSMTVEEVSGWLKSIGFSDDAINQAMQTVFGENSFDAESIFDAQRLNNVLEGYGQDFVDGYTGAIEGGAGDASSAASTMVQSGLDAVPATQASASPSAITQGYGKDFADGYSLGIQENASNAATAAAMMVSEATAVAQATPIVVTVETQTVTDTSGASQGGKEVAKAGADAMASASGQFTSAGSNAGEGFKSGLESKRASIMSVARSIANEVAATIRAALNIHSPSRVMMELGSYTGEGFEVGLRQSLNSAVATARGVVSSMNLAPNTGVEALGDAINGLTEASGEGSKLYLNVNGKTLADVTTNNFNSALNANAHRIALGYGRG